MTLCGEPGGGRVVAPIRHVDVPQVRKLGEHPDDLGRLSIVGDPHRPDQLVHGQPYRHGAVAADGIAGVLDQLAQEPRTVAEASAVLVGPVVVPPRQQLHRQCESVRCIAVDDVEARVPRTQRSCSVPAPDVGEVSPSHRPGLHGFVPCSPEHALASRAEGRQARIMIRGIKTRVGELDTGQRAVRVHGLRHQAQAVHIRVVPEAAFDAGSDVGRWMDLDLLCAHHAPSALGFHPPHRGMRLWPQMSQPVAVRHLIEAVGCDLRPDLYLFEEDVVVAHTVRPIIGPGLPWWPRQALAKVRVGPWIEYTLPSTLSPSGDTSTPGEGRESGANPAAPLTTS